MKLSIAIVNWNTRDDLRRCLASIDRNRPSFPFETIVVDNASPDGSAGMTAEQFPWARLITNQTNAGYAEGNNQAIRESTGEYVLLLNPDTEIPDGALQALVRFGESHSEMAAVGCRLIGSDGHVQMSCRSFPTPSGVMFEYLRLSRLFPQSRFFGSYRMTYFDYAHEAEVDQPMASCLLLSRAAIDDVGLIDEDFPIFFNDVDWCYRAKEKGWRIYFTPDVEVRHLGGASTKQARPTMVLESHRSLQRFYEKHYSSRLPRLTYLLIMAAICANAFLFSRLHCRGAQG